ncbi:MAG TPA: ABC transporter substrate binding protein [Myxococcaceae bacterium]|nr:ABC transporter substrate binding protein [Myxococcaceae bacterium]
MRALLNRCLLIFVLTLTAVGPAAAATGPVMLVDGKAPQNRQVADAVKKEAPEVEEISPEDAQRASEAPVIIAVGASAYAQAKGLGSVPVVACMMLGLNGGQLPANVTGVRLEVDPDQVVSFIRSLGSGGKAQLVVHPGMADFRARAKQAAAAAGLSLVEALAPDAAKAREALAKVEPTVTALWLAPDARIITPEVFSSALQISRQRKVPLIGFLPAMTRAGAVGGYSANYEGIGRLAAQMARRISQKNGPTPSLQFSPGDLTLNAPTAKELGLKLDEKLMQAATYVFR